MYCVKTVVSVRLVSNQIMYCVKTVVSVRLVSKQTWCLTSTETIRLIRDGENGGRGYGGGGKVEILYLSPHCRH